MSNIRWAVTVSVKRETDFSRLNAKIVDSEAEETEEINKEEKDDMLSDLGINLSHSEPLEYEVVKIFENLSLKPSGSGVGFGWWDCHYHGLTEQQCWQVRKQYKEKFKPDWFFGHPLIEVSYMPYTEENENESP